MGVKKGQKVHFLGVFSRLIYKEMVVGEGRKNHFFWLVRVFGGSKTGFRGFSKGVGSKFGFGGENGGLVRSKTSIWKYMEKKGYFPLEMPKMR